MLWWLQKHGKKDGKAEEMGQEDQSGGYLQYYIETILGNFELKITNVHIRYEVCVLLVLACYEMR